MRLAERMERIAKASDAVKELVKAVAELFDQIRDESRIDGGVRVTNFNPLEIEWWLNLPEEKEEER